MLWVGLILAVIGGVLLFVSTRAAGRAQHMSTIETSRVGDIVSLVNEVKAELPGESTGYHDYVELKGSVACDAPVMGELSGLPAALVETTVKRRYEERREVRDSDGRVTTRWETRTETVSNNKRESPFYLDDGTGRVRVLATGASLDLDEVVDRFEPANAVEVSSGGNVAISFGRMSISLGGGRWGNDRRTLGYQFTERIMPVGRPLYVLGEVADTPDGLLMRKPQDGSKRPYLVSLKSEEELVQKAQSSAKWQKIGGVALIALGVVLALVGIIT